jgi:hypothetical protein
MDDDDDSTYCTVQYKCTTCMYDTVLVVYVGCSIYIYITSGKIVEYYGPFQSIVQIF